MSSLGGIPKKSINPSGAIKTDTVIENIEVENLTVGTDGFHPTEPDSMLGTGSSDGTKTGTKRANKIDDDGDLRVKDVQAGTILAAIQTLLASGIIKVDDDASQVLLTNILSQLASGGLVIRMERRFVFGNSLCDEAVKLLSVRNRTLGKTSAQVNQIIATFAPIEMALRKCALPTAVGGIQAMAPSFPEYSQDFDYLLNKLSSFLANEV